MNTRSAIALLILLVPFSAVAANAPDTAPPPSGTVSSTTGSAGPPRTSSPAGPAVDTAKPQAAAPTGKKTSDGDFKPSEEVSEDMAVAYPVDI